MPNADTEEFQSALAELERIGWPCRLVELPEKYDQLARENQRMRKRLINANRLRTATQALGDFPRKG